MMPVVCVDAYLIGCSRSKRLQSKRLRQQPYRGRLWTCVSRSPREMKPAPFLLFLQTAKPRMPRRIAAMPPPRQVLTSAGAARGRRPRAAAQPLQWPARPSAIDQVGMDLALVELINPRGRVRARRTSPATTDVSWRMDRAANLLRMYSLAALKPAAAGASTTRLAARAARGALGFVGDAAKTGRGPGRPLRGRLRRQHTPAVRFPNAGLRCADNGRTQINGCREIGPRSSCPDGCTA